MEIEIPSPSVFLRQSPVLPATDPTPVKKSTNSLATVQTRQPPKSSTTTIDAKANDTSIKSARQNKSRNGCITCKKKRLKCDETKPDCVQCEKRKVKCEGYKKNFKWRTFEDISKQSRAGKRKKFYNATAQGDAPALDFITPSGQPTSSHSNEEPSHLQSDSPSPTQGLNEELPPTDKDPKKSPPSQSGQPPSVNGGTTPSHADLPSAVPASDIRPSEPEENGGSSSSPAGSPTLLDILLQGTELSDPPDSPDLQTPRSPLPCEPEFDETDSLSGIAVPDDEEIGDAVGEESDHDQMHFAPDWPGFEWMFGALSPTNSQNSTSSSRSTNLSLIKAPRLDPSSPEMLMLRFDRETCGILSIKDGPSENPWRTLIWPLAKDSQALYHAISAMAALHGATHQPQLKMTGVAHMTKSISKLSTEMHKMSLEQMLASALALALGEGWDDKISTGIQHLKGAKTLLNKALTQRSRSLQLGQLSREDAKRLKFLANTYVYLDAIARLTTTEEHDHIDLDNIIQAVNEPMDGGEYEIDPLMGCATTLFPLLGKVGSLIQRIRKIPTNSLNIVSEASELREQLLQWKPPDLDLVEQPEDPSSRARHALQTAEAYRRAILLHLHSAVPELSCEPAHDLAKGTLTLLAATPLSSRTIIIQIFPLLVGSCEMVDPDDRQWVTQRWDAMMKRLTIVNVASCWEIVKEVWRRRDQWAEMQAPRMSPVIRQSGSPGQFIPRAMKRKMNRADVVTEDPFFDPFSQGDDTSHSHLGQTHIQPHPFDISSGLEPGRRPVRLRRRHTEGSTLSREMEFTVRGHLHWLGVMSDWNWEVFL